MNFMMECGICHKKELSKTKCQNNHYVCNECHVRGVDSIIGICMNEVSKNPVIVLEKLMALPFCHMHGPEHHVMVGAALLTAYRNAGGEIMGAFQSYDIQSSGKNRLCRWSPLLQA